MSDDKYWYQSKTVWLNVLMLAAMLLTGLIDVPLVSDNPTALKVIVAIQAVVNVLLRFVTDSSLLWKVK